MNIMFYRFGWNCYVICIYKRWGMWADVSQCPAMFHSHRRLQRLRQKDCPFLSETALFTQLFALWPGVSGALRPPARLYWLLSRVMSFIKVTHHDLAIVLLAYHFGVLINVEFWHVRCRQKEWYCLFYLHNMHFKNVNIKAITIQ